MRNFRVQVNGKPYDVVVEDMGVSNQQVTASPAPQRVQPAPAPVKEKIVNTPAASGANAITSPMPGIIMNVNVKVGDAVSPNTIVAILEAMKMENEIFAGKTGVVESISVAKGASVNTGDVILILK